MHRRVHEYASRFIVDGIFVLDNDGRDERRTTLPMVNECRRIRSWWDDTSPKGRTAVEDNDNELISMRTSRAAARFP